MTWTSRQFYPFCLPLIKLSRVLLDALLLFRVTEFLHRDFVEILDLWWRQKRDEFLSESHCLCESVLRARHHKGLFEASQPCAKQPRSASHWFYLFIRISTVKDHPTERWSSYWKNAKGVHIFVLFFCFFIYYFFAFCHKTTRPRVSWQLFTCSLCHLLCFFIWVRSCEFAACLEINVRRIALSITWKLRKIDSSWYGCKLIVFNDQIKMKTIEQGWLYGCEEYW